MQLYERFYKGFSPFGEPNIPIDTGGPVCNMLEQKAVARWLLPAQA